MSRPCRSRNILPKYPDLFAPAQRANSPRNAPTVQSAGRLTAVCELDDPLQEPARQLLAVHQHDGGASGLRTLIERVRALLVVNRKAARPSALTISLARAPGRRASILADDGRPNSDP